MLARWGKIVALAAAGAIVAGGVALADGSGSGTDPAGDGSPAKLDILSYQAAATIGGARGELTASVSFAADQGAESDTTKVELDYGTGSGSTCSDDIRMYAYRDGGSATVKYQSARKGPEADSGPTTLSADGKTLTFKVLLREAPKVDPTCVSVKTISDNDGPTADSAGPTKLGSGTPPAATPTPGASPTPVPTTTPKPSRPRPKKCKSKKYARAHKKQCRKKKGKKH